MKDTVFRLLVHFLIAGLSLAAPANPPNGLNLFSDDSDGPFQINTNSTNTLGTNVRISYSIPSSKLSLLLVYMDVKPIERKALGYTLQRAQQSRRAYLATHPDTYLDPAQYDDPFRADYLRTGKCALRIQSVHVGGPGKQRMT
ncbi:MAG: hypothetical protein L6R39_001497, partial [Caloplaca ligustica]